MNLLWFLLIGLAAGWLASQIMKGVGSGLVTDLIMGVIGSLLRDAEQVSGVLHVWQGREGPRPAGPQDFPSFRNRQKPARKISRTGRDCLDTAACLPGYRQRNCCGTSRPTVSRRTASQAWRT
jgi:uncharacterized membrane protein YeaQ/YmgE (transglycosylase-associated protein family)